MTQKKLQERRARLRKLDRELKKLFPQVGIELNFANPVELLVAVQLSAQCTDKMVNRITAMLFKKYPTLEAYLAAGPGEFAQDIKPCGYYNAKARNILGALRMLKEEFNGRVPTSIEKLLRLPGVGRKTATVVLAESYGIIDGITVDTHVIRFVHRYDLSDHKDPVKIERDLMELLPKKEWRDFTHRVIHYGRYLAPARKYDTSRDPLIRIYPAAEKRFRV